MTNDDASILHTMRKVLPRISAVDHSAPTDLGIDSQVNIHRQAIAEVSMKPSESAAEWPRQKLWTSS